MFRTLKQLASPINKDLRQRIGFTLLVLLIFVIGVNVRVPGTQDYTGSLGFLEIVNAMSGGALRNFSIFALGVMPYISASIIMQLLQMDIIPYFSELQKQGPVGRQKINKITRYMGIIFAFIQGFAYSFMMMKTASAFDRLYVSLILTAGTAFLLWLGDQVTQKGIGNGISLLIMAGIIVEMPGIFINTFKQLILSGRYDLWQGGLMFAGFILVYLLIIIGVIFVQEAERKITIQYANKSTVVAGNRSYMPMKINAAGVVPVIFASSLLAIPATIANFANNAGFTNFVNNYLTYTKPVGFVIYMLLIYFFSYIYTFIQIKPEELAKNLNEAGGFVPGVRPGKDTENHINKILIRLTFVGGFFIAILAAIPIVFSMIGGLESAAAIGGTSLLIVVGVALETYKQLEGSLVARNYKKGYSRR
ncbi:MAG: preprotein translocase subunit SecY [Firmicutes bacterium]|nr:preprotein translocase subunit SecY [Bacillota bacterium]